MMKTFLWILMISPLLFAEDRVLGALRDKALAQEAARLNTSDRIAFYSELSKARPDARPYRVLLAGSFIQKARETTDFAWLNRAESILQGVLAEDSSDYSALRLRTEILLERHDFRAVVKHSRDLVEVAPDDPWNYATLGDAYVELGQYDAAEAAWSKMMRLRPDMASYNRAAHFRFLQNDLNGAIETMGLAVSAGGTSPENVAWCQTELGNLYRKAGKSAEAATAFRAALRSFPGFHAADAGLGRLQAEAGDTASAIASFRRAQSVTPLPEYAAALYDLYTTTSQAAEAAAQKRQIEAVDDLARANGEKANRALALILADHGWKPERALELARAEFEFRQDIYSWDTLAWALFRNGKLTEAAEASAKALQLKTPEPSFHQHADAIRAAIAATTEVKP